ncbi:hypothetical protein FF36_04628 [Frankia torreyi]|uniref:Uncharacterized protein n=1 Tax=Frankia torreyi TaxID=1856 RepID=A0A0D8BAQ4_9ACTN|nr:MULTISPECIES: hypothetical protein [Frankia]KJE21034.1 hypothetical protein FF36_04628 [Frankia torreyi]KQC39649.1 hypothetical protein UK82_03050 [Frankia sp. ACN1ag]
MTEPVKRRRSLLGDALPARTFDQGVDLEVAEWILGALTARISSLLAEEPDETVAQSLRAERAALAAERRRMIAGGPSAVARVLQEYGPRARQLREERQ